MAQDFEHTPFPRTFDDLRQATSAQRQAIYKRVINDPDIVRILVRGLTVAEADSVIAAFDAAARRTQLRTVRDEPQSTVAA